MRSDRVGILLTGSSDEVDILKRSKREKGSQEMHKN
jgi:hypothetical protein